MNIVFMGTPSFAVPSLKLLCDSGYDISAVVTVPDRQKGRGQKLQPSEVKIAANELGLKILQPEKLKDENFVKELKSLEPDLIIVTAFRILPPEVYKIPKYGSFNLHASLLPKYRGAAPINWAIINGEKETGVTTFFLQDKVDTGNIILQKRTDIADTDNFGTLYERLSQIGAELTIETVRSISEEKTEIQKQDDSLSSPAPKIFKDDCKINWNDLSDNIFNFIRGLSPYPTAFTFLDGKVLKIYDCEISSIQSEKPGIMFIKEKSLYISTKDNCLKINSLQLEGKKRMPASYFINSLDKTKEYIMAIP